MLANMVNLLKRGVARGLMRRRAFGATGLVLAWLGLAAVALAGERHVPLQGQPNFRDLGGYRGEGGRTVRWGQVYRSGELSGLTPGDQAEIEELGIRSVVTFLTPEEIAARGDDRLPPGIRSIPSPAA